VWQCIPQAGKDKIGLKSSEAIDAHEHPVFCGLGGELLTLRSPGE